MKCCEDCVVVVVTTRGTGVFRKFLVLLVLVCWAGIISIPISSSANEVSLVMDILFR